MTAEPYQPQQQPKQNVACQGRRRCTKKAVYLIRLHPIDNCVGRDEIVYRMCKACTFAAGWRVGEAIGGMYAQLPDDETEPIECICDTCGRRIMELHDVFEVERLKPQ
jgi:hypothetical protein